jgi:hypothetical protein
VFLNQMALFNYAARPRAVICNSRIVLRKVTI